MSMYRPKKQLSPEKGSKQLTNKSNSNSSNIKNVKKSEDSLNTTNNVIIDESRTNPPNISVISTSRLSTIQSFNTEDNIIKNVKNEIIDMNSQSKEDYLLESNFSDLNKPINKPLKNIIHISLRWINLSATLCSLIFPLSSNSDTNISNESVKQFLDVMKWRAIGDINETEFTVLYDEFLSTTNFTSNNNENTKKQSNTNVSKPNKKKQNSITESMIGVHKLRDYLIDKEISESDLDLYIGMLMNEVNLRLLNSSISFNNIPISMTLDENIRGSKGSYVLETCTSRWLSLCEECFFCLDTPGYGILRFDEVFFLSACLSIGVQGWTDSVELEGDLALGTLTAMTVQLIRDCGACTSMTSDSINISQQYLQSSKFSELSSSSKLLDDIDSSSMTNLNNNNSVKSQYGKHGITVTMFKLYLMNKGIGESSLNTLINHIRSCSNKVARISKNCAEELYNSFKSVDDFGNQISTTIGCPRIWQQAVLSYSDVGSMNNKNIPPIVLFLLTDGDKYISSLLRAMECSIDGTKFIEIDSKKLSKSQQPLHSASIANDELHEISYKLWLLFRIWSVGNIRGNNGLHGNSFVNSANIGGSGDAHRDPIYQFIVAVIVQYKALQNLLCAALYDMAVTNFGFPQSNNSIKEFSKTLLSVAAANLIPDYTLVLVELGFESDISNNVESFTSDNDNYINSVPFIRDDENKESPIKSLTIDDENNGPLHLNDLHNPIEDKRTNEHNFSKTNDKSFKISSSRHAERKKYELNQFIQQSNKKKNISSPEIISSNNSLYLSPDQQQIPIIYDSDNQNQMNNNRDASSLHNTHNNLVTKSPEITINNISSQGNIVDENKVTKVTNELISALQNLGYSVTPKGFLDAKDVEISIPITSNQNIQYISDLKDIQITRSNSFSISDASSSVAPSSIADLLQQGQTAGKYAQMLREILRKMSKDDSNVKLKSLEQVIKLGNTLVQTELENNETNKVKSPQSVNKVKINKIKESSKELNKPSSPNEQFSIHRVSKVPGHIPSYGGNKSSKKVFGHKMN